MGKRVLVTGGASFIGSHLVEKLKEEGAWVRVVDDLSSGKAEYVEGVADQFIVGDLRKREMARMACVGMDEVYHLAADHGGRGYVDLHQVACSRNMLLDSVVFEMAATERVDKIVYASSGCVYPTDMQTHEAGELYLREEDAFPARADGMYGWAKLMGEETLRAYHQELGISTGSARLFTVFGPRGKEDHAIMAMLARAFVQQDPFDIWGDGRQVRNWTYVDDIVDGILAVGRHVHDGSAYNIGTEQRTTVEQAALLAISLSGYSPDLRYLKHMPTGPVNRVASNEAARRDLGWEPKWTFEEAVIKTWEWYTSSKDKMDVFETIATKLTER